MSASEAVESDLVAQAASRDTQAMEVLVRRWHLRLMSAALRLLAYRQHDAEEAVQETWIRVWHSLHTLKDATRWAGWVHRILRNVCIQRRSKRSELLGQAALTPTYVEAPVDSEIEGQNRRRLAEAIQRMPDAYREAVILRYLQKLEYRAIAEALEIAEGTAKSNVHKGLAWLQKNFSLAEHSNG